ncbi:tripartite tricarboxylate transporter TctB family protein [Bifidobacterium sp. 82T10]|uniref:Tripartite tricarboxylate transporter TctB family protein n=1 Tax=Bifidobacterium miconis TaxID=2834435 RepID=A0ABS6WIH5_9BIFI|nr:tripartite tricarboxylate transporter TctB family protein [Bifidobacterium miconis]MBW3093672.1 tripartite tricarboxylate transporter TctB family protein [Bifidobacterium miconis]
MANRAERRKAARDQRRGIPSQYDQTKGRARGGMIDEYALQERSRRIQEGTLDDGPWKPTAHFDTDETETLLDTNPDYRDPKAFKAPHSVHQWFRVVSWLLIVLAGIAFCVIMWLPSHPTWLVITVSIVFIIGVVSLFFTAGNAKDNPNLDQNGTAV